MISECDGPDQVWGCVLIGGKSSRMGTPKHLILQDGQTWVERTVTLLQQMLGRVVVAGAGELPPSLQGLTQVPDAANIGGPLAGILSALRAFPQVSFLVVACDQPDMRIEAVQWLLGCREPGVLAVMPAIAGTGRVEPLLAYYDRAILPVLEEMAAGGHRRMNRLQSVPGVKTPTPPSHLHDSWHNINTPDDLVKSSRPLPSIPHR
ncbi:MAG: molybdenum cofactor guanylyltransferase [Desulfobulbus sp.]|nr:molybdenum cofactor guanylyltransferase [Desulfobulbus sp.]